MDETQVLPLFSGIITAKVLRIDSGSSAKRKLFVKKNLNPKFGKDSASDGAAAPVVPKSAKSNQQPPAAAQVQASRPPVAPPIAPQPPKPQEEPAPFIDLFNGDDPVKAPSASFGGVSGSSGGVDIDIDEGRAPAASPLNRVDLVAKREAEIQEKVDTALQFKIQVRISLYLIIEHY